MLHQVGVGALGPVFRTYEPTRDRLVAIKVFRLDITPEQAQSLADELSRTADAGLFHPSIVEPIAAGVEGSVAYRAEEYVAAETLDVAMRHYAPAPVEKVLPFIAQLAGAIDFARTAGVGHGGLHPRDIFVTPDEARANGFGVVEALERVGIRAPVRRPYTAPERVAGEGWGATADVFSLGVIAYELLTGRRPSGMGERIGTITGGANQAAIHAVLARAVAEDPADRFPSALAFASALDAASRGEGPSIAAPAAGAGVSAGVVAAGAMPPDPDEAMEEVPPPAGVSAHRESVEPEQEEHAFRPSEPEFDDVAAEREDDDAPAVFPRHDPAVTPSVTDEPARNEPEAPLFAAAGTAGTAGNDDQDEYAEASDDLTLERDDVRETERFADEFAEAAEHEREADRRFDDEDGEEPAVAAYGSAPAVFREREDTAPYAQPAVLPERAGFGIVPMALLLLLALLVGFAGGRAIGGRTSAPETGIAADATESPDASSSPAPPYTEGAVTSPSGQPSAPAAQPEPATTVAAPPSVAPEPAEPEPAEPVATTGEIEVRSTPSGAGVTVDGRWAGRTPLTLDELAFGAHEIRIVQPGFDVAREQVRLSADQPSRELAFRLQRTAPPPSPAPRAKPRPAPAPPAKPVSYTGSIYVDSRPRGARVLVNGKLMGTTPLRIPDVAIGSQIVRLELENHRFWTTTTRVAAGQESRVTGSLEPIR